MSTNSSYEKRESTFTVKSGSAQVTLVVNYASKSFQIKSFYDDEKFSFRTLSVEKTIDVANAIRNAAEIAKIELEENKPAVNWETLSPVEPEEKESFIAQAKKECLHDFTVGIAETILSGSRGTPEEMPQTFKAPKGEFIFLDKDEKPIPIAKQDFDCLHPDTLTYIGRIASFGGGTVHLSDLEHDYFVHYFNLKHKNHHA